MKRSLKLLMLLPLLSSCTVENDYYGYDYGYQSPPGARVEVPSSQFQHAQDVRPSSPRNYHGHGEVRSYHNHSNTTNSHFHGHQDAHNNQVIIKNPSTEHRHPSETEHGGEAYANGRGNTNYGDNHLHGHD